MTVHLEERRARKIVAGFSGVGMAVAARIIHVDWWTVAMPLLAGSFVGGLIGWGRNLYVDSRMTKLPSVVNYKK